MNYKETVEYLYAQAPLFQNIGQGAYKEGLETTYRLDEYLGHPHRQYRTIHVAGTNGKGSTAHTIAAVLQSAGYKVGLYTSPHLIDMRERIRVNGEKIPESYVVDFVARHRAFFEPLHPSFFEVLTGLAFRYFADEMVDIAIVEVGLGGRLDCTNIIHPDMCVITNIALDHTDLLGNTISEIAAEKAGIMKKGVPVVAGQTSPEIRKVFEHCAKTAGAHLYYSEDENDKRYESYDFQLKGDCQAYNKRTILSVLRHLPDWYHIQPEDIAMGLSHVCELTGLMGRWQVLNEEPIVICDTGHNPNAWELLSKKLDEMANSAPLHVVFGIAADKDISHVISMLPKSGRYYFTQASVRRALPAERLQQVAKTYNIDGEVFSSVDDAYSAAFSHASADGGRVFVGGSSFIVADLLTSLKR